LSIHPHCVEYNVKVANANSFSSEVIQTDKLNSVGSDSSSEKIGSHDVSRNAVLLRRDGESVLILLELNGGA